MAAVIRLRHSVIIDRPPPEVWAFVSDPANNTRWQSGVTKSGAVSGGPVGVGTRVRVVRRFLGRSIETVFDTTEFEPGVRFAFKTVSGPIALEGSITVRSVEGGTEVVYSGQGEVGSALRFGEPIVGRIVNKQAKADFRALKKLLESP